MFDNTLLRYCEACVKHKEVKSYLDKLFLEEDRKTLRVLDRKMLKTLQRKAAKRVFALHVAILAAYAPFVGLLLFGWAHLWLGTFENNIEFWGLGLAYIVSLWGMCRIFIQTHVAGKTFALIKERLVADGLSLLEDEVLIERLRDVAKKSDHANTIIQRGATLHEVSLLLRCPRGIV